MIKAINVYWKFHDNRIASVTNSVYSRFKIGIVFLEANDGKLYKYYVYEQVTESYIGKARVPVEYSRTARVDDCKPVKYLVQTILENGSKYLKHRL